MTVTHRMSKTPTYRSWRKMRERCLNPNTWQYKYYGARGVLICERWNSFENFLEDMGIRPEGTSLDRVNTNGPYAPENCRWADRKAQARGQRKTILVDGRPLREICEERGLNFNRAYQRFKRGQSSNQILFDGPLYPWLWEREPGKKVAP